MELLRLTLMRRVLFRRAGCRRFRLGLRVGGPVTSGQLGRRGGSGSNEEGGEGLYLDSRLVMPFCSPEVLRGSTGVI